MKSLDQMIGLFDHIAPTVSLMSNEHNHKCYGHGLPQATRMRTYIRISASEGSDKRLPPDEMYSPSDVLTIRCMLTFIGLCTYLLMYSPSAVLTFRTWCTYPPMYSASV